MKGAPENKALRSGKLLLQQPLSAHNIWRRSHGSAFSRPEISWHLILALLTQDPIIMFSSSPNNCIHTSWIDCVLKKKKKKNANIVLPENRHNGSVRHYTAHTDNSIPKITIKSTNKVTETHPCTISTDKAKIGLLWQNSAGWVQRKGQVSTLFFFLKKLFNMS